MQHSFAHSSKLRILAFLEASSLAILVFVALPIRLLLERATFVHVIGPLHGLFFVTYIWTILNLAASGELSSKQASKLALYACIPLGGFVSFVWLSRGASTADR
jgi:integral membrane protein